MDPVNVKSMRDVAAATRELLVEFQEMRSYVKHLEGRLASVEEDQGWLARRPPLCNIPKFPRILRQFNMYPPGEQRA